MAPSPKSQDVAVKPEGGIMAQVLAGTYPLPEQFTGVIDFPGWIRSLLNREDYTEPNPEYLQTMLLMQTLMSLTPEEVFTQGGVRKLQESIPNVPGASTGPIDIYDLYVTDSDFGEGAKTYIIMSTRDLETGVEAKYSTGAQQVQAQLLALVVMQGTPVRCKIVRMERKDRGGRFMFWIEPADGN